MKHQTALASSINPTNDLLHRLLWRSSFLLRALGFTLVCFVISHAARAECRQGCDDLGWVVDGNTFFGEDAFLNGTTGNGNTVMGHHALLSNTEGWHNTAIGNRALVSDLGGSGWYNTAVGSIALASNTDGSENTAVGFLALSSNTTASGNTAVGSYALDENTTGTDNTAIGVLALEANTTGSNNTANGANALFSNTTGGYNTATGDSALYGPGPFEPPSTGSFNVADGSRALFSNSTGSSNVANGFYAMYTNTTGSFNAANGANALEYNTIGGGNVANGGFALFTNTTGMNNVAEGFDALFNNTTGNNNIGIGIGAGGALTTGDNNIDIGNAGVAGESAKIRIGTKPTHKNTYIAGIHGVTVARGIGVIIDSAGHLGTTTSSARFKDKIQPMDKASEAILALEPVTFRYRQELDPEQVPQFGLVAEQVAKVNPDLVARDEEGKPYTVRYEAVNAMLLNEFLKGHRKAQAQDATIAELKSNVAKQEAVIAQQQKSFETTIAQQQKQIETLTSTLREQASQIQKVSARVTAADQSALRVVVNNQLETNR